MSESYAAAEPQVSPASPHEGEGRKRVTQACNRCRVKKIKCTGEIPCPRCAADDAVCQFGLRRQSSDKPVSHSYVNQLEVQQKILTQALKAVWKKYGPVEERGQHGDDSIHCIVSQLGILESSGADLGGGGCGGGGGGEQQSACQSSPPSPTTAQHGYDNIATRTLASDVRAWPMEFCRSPPPCGGEHEQQQQQQHSFMMTGSHDMSSMPPELQHEMHRSLDPSSHRGSYQASDDFQSYGQPSSSSMSTDYLGHAMTDSGQVPLSPSQQQQQQQHYFQHHHHHHPQVVNMPGTSPSSGAAEPWQHSAAVEFASMMRGIPGFNHGDEKYERLWHDFLHEMPE